VWRAVRRAIHLPRFPLSLPFLRFAAMTSNSRRAAGLVAALVFGLLAAAPLLLNSGFLMTRGGGDSPFLLLRLHQMVEALRGGQLPVRWMPDAAYGYGYPFFSYYAALPYYLAALFHFYGFSFNLSLKLTQLGALLLAALGAYAWARSLPLATSAARADTGMSRPAALLVSAAYSFAPFHLVNLYVRGDSLSELWAMSFYPLILWSAQRCLRRPSFGSAFALALSAGLLAITHNISALIFMPFVALYVVLAGGTFKGLKALRGLRETPLTPPGRPIPVSRVLLAGLALAWGLALAAFFWLPALREINYAQISDVTQGYFFYANHFRAADLVQPGLLFSFETTPDGPTPFSMGLVQAVLAAAGLAGLAWRAARTRHWGWAESFLVLGLAVSTLMITPLSDWLWRHLPLLAYAQFPWRFLSIQALFAAAVIGQLVPAGSRSVGADQKTAAAPAFVAVALSLTLALAGMARLRPDFVPLADAGVTPASLHLLETFTANIGSTIGYEYLPRAVQPRPYVSDAVLGRPPRLKALVGTAQGSQQWRRGAAEQWAINVIGGPATVAVPRYFWPGWRADVDGQDVPVRPAPNLGWIALDLPPGEHSVTLHLGRTPLRAAAEALSVLALIFPAAGFVAARLASNTTLKAPSDRGALPQPQARTRLLLTAALLAVAGSVGLHAGQPPGASSMPLSMDFDLLAYPHRSIIPFEGGARLTGLAYSSQHLAPGGALAITTEWQPAGAPLSVSLSLVPPANLLDHLPRSLSSQALALPTGTAASLTHSLQVPGDLAPGLYYVTLQVHEGGLERRALTSAGRARGLLHLAPVWVDGDGPAASVGESLADFGAGIELLSADSRAGDARLEIDLLWRAQREVPGNYQVALRLRDAAGFEWAGLDRQPGYGFYPTSLWRPGQAVPDSYRLRLPPGLPPAEYDLRLDLYDPLGLAGLGGVDLTARVDAATPAGNRQPLHNLLPGLALADFSFPARFDQGDAPEIRAGWLTGADFAGRDYRARWTLTPRGEGQSVTHLLALAPGSPPSTWPPGAYVLGRARLATDAGLSPGPYDLSLALVDAAGQEAAGPLLVAQTEVLGRARVFEPPPMQAQVGATFGDILKLWGYTADFAAGQGAARELRLTLVWGALAAPGADYKYFVHLHNPADDSVLAQVDAEPRNFTYPTALWVAGEVVADTVTLDLAGLPPGSYRLAVGWYDPNSPGLDRLPAFDAGGHRLGVDRVILPLEISVP
jgi:hypothetical protein